MSASALLVGGVGLGSSPSTGRFDRFAGALDHRRDGFADSLRCAAGNLYRLVARSSYRR